MEGKNYHCEQCGYQLKAMPSPEAVKRMATSDMRFLSLTQGKCPNDWNELTED
jgi:hypothetical protein